MGGCQNYGPFWGTLNFRCRIFNRGPKRDHNFDNHPYSISTNSRVPQSLPSMVRDLFLISSSKLFTPNPIWVLV